MDFLPFNLTCCLVIKFTSSVNPQFVYYSHILILIFSMPNFNQKNSHPFYLSREQPIPKHSPVTVHLKLLRWIYRNKYFFFTSLNLLLTLLLFNSTVSKDLLAEWATVFIILSSVLIWIATLDYWVFENLMLKKLSCLETFSFVCELTKNFYQNFYISVSNISVDKSIATKVTLLTI